MPFPADFIWATATSAYQTEGGGTEHGRGESTWDAIRKEKGRIRDGSSPEDSILGYDQWKEDIQLIKATGVSHYRLSLSWSRILPNGTNDAINEEGIRFYRNVLGELLRNGITPMVTLFHFDWPLALFDRGGWLNKDSQKWFLDFSSICFKEFGDLVPIWMTFNEIGMHILTAVCKLEGEGFHSPSRPSSGKEDEEPFLAAHNMLLAHAMVYRLYEKEFKGKFGGRVGIVEGCLGWCIGEDEQIVRRARDFNLGHTLDPLIFGDYPEYLKLRLNGANGFPALPSFTEEEQILLKGAVDFVGINYYVPRVVGKGKGKTLFERLGDYELLGNDWEKISGEDSWTRNYPQGLKDMFVYFKEHYGNIPTLVTENGCSDLPGSGLEDENRIRLIRSHVKAVEEALQEGCRVIGYTVWSLMDNFEWDDGFGMRFGMYSVDFSSPEKTRTPKKSVGVYRELIKSARQGDHL